MGYSAITLVMDTFLGWNALTIRDFKNSILRHRFAVFSTIKRFCHERERRASWCGSACKGRIVCLDSIERRTAHSSEREKPLLS